MRMHLGKRRRAAIAAIAAIAWTVGPWTPAVVCAIGGMESPAAVAPVPDCHSHANSNTSTPEDRSHDCCKDVADSCCLEATSIVGTPTTAKTLDAPAVVVLAFGARPIAMPTAPPSLPTTANPRTACTGPPLSTCILRL